LAHTPVGQIIRPVTPADDYDWHRLQNSGPLICADGRRWAADSNLRLELLDIEILLDGSTAVIQFLGEAANREAELAEFLHRKHGLKILLENLSVPVPPDEHAHAGCGKPDCGREAGGCTSCSTGGGCSSCGAGKVDMRAYFAHLRDKMDERPRTSLL
jgi:hypothetical protein